MNDDDKNKEEKKEPEDRQEQEVDPRQAARDQVEAMGCCPDCGSPAHKGPCPRAG